MYTNYDLKSILVAIESINTKTTKKKTSPQLINVEQIKKNFFVNKEVSPITEKLILEAEEYSNKFKNIPLSTEPSAEEVLVLDNELNINEAQIRNLEEIKLNLVNDVYSSLSKKIKKNTLKTIFDLRLKINNLEEKITEINLYKKNIDIQNDHNPKKKIEHLINEESTEKEEKFILDSENDNLPDTVIKTLKLQNSLIKNFENNEEKLRIKIVDLEQDISLLNNKKNKQ
jgi:hypothetical protein